MSLRKRLLIVSNRLPITVVRTGAEPSIQPSSGGLVSALLSLLQNVGGCWVGWPGTAEAPAVLKALQDFRYSRCSLEPVFLSPEEEVSFYNGCSNEIIWPLFHDLQSRCKFDPTYWTVYCEANEKFADAVERLAVKDDFVWVHDYHLMLLGEALRARGMRSTIAYFHHIPFPPPDIFEKLPWRREILRALLRFSMIGLQTDRDRRNFFACVRRYLQTPHVQRIGGRFLVRTEGLCSTVGTFPVSIDYQRFSVEGDRPGVLSQAAEIQGSVGSREIILGIDRLDYTKGIPERLSGFRALLRRHPELHGRVVLLQVIVPSREAIPQYHDLKERIEREVSAINGEFGQPSWTPVIYLHKCLTSSELLAYYRAAHVALITPLKDGMNLVAKEFCATRSDQRGVLVLSEFAGAAVELNRGALLVNPYDAEGIASALETALRMSDSEQNDRMRKMRAVIEGNDVFRWCRSVCGQPAGRQLVSMPAPHTDAAMRSAARAV
ncbi:MAG: trehalose-6-phosphate synthase [Acidobacteriales bacterium]|nr:trehalose-6-phosphate synthase [Terriglobales bacterium]